MTTTFNAELFVEQFIHSFQQGDTMLAACCYNQSIGRGDRAHFLIAGAAGNMVTRAADGSIPFEDISDSQVTCTLTAKFHKQMYTEEQMQEGQAKISAIAAERARKKVNREWDQTILTALNASTNYYSATASAITFTDVLEISAEMASDDVPDGDTENFAVVSPKMWAQMEAWDEFTSADYTEVRHLDRNYKMRNWKGFNWMRHPHVPGVGTADSRCFFFNKNAIGHAVPRESQDVRVDHEKTDFRYVCAAKLYHGAIILQSNGVVSFKHDDTAAVSI